MTRYAWQFRKFIFPLGAAALIALTFAGVRAADNTPTAGKTPLANDDKLPIDPAASQIRPGDWNQWGGSPVRDNTPTAKNIPTEWDVGKFDDQTGGMEERDFQKHPLGSHGLVHKVTATPSWPMEKRSWAPTMAKAI